MFCISKSAVKHDGIARGKVQVSLRSIQRSSYYYPESPNPPIPFSEAFQFPKMLRSWFCISISAAGLPHAKSIKLPCVKTTPVWFAALPNCARLVVFGLYIGHPKLRSPCAGLRAKATHALCMYRDNAISTGVAGMLLTL